MPGGAAADSPGDEPVAGPELVEHRRLGDLGCPRPSAGVVHGDRTALLTPDGGTTYRELAARVADTARRLGPERRLVLLPGANTPEALVVHLAALSAGHPVLLVPGDHPEALRSLTEAYDPDVVVRPAAPGEPWVLDERRTASTHDLHPDLALLLSTSGSTGSPKLVRLSYDNLQANAESIAAYLGIRETDRAATTLPMHYCYGLSVLHSHLLRGAGLILTGLSVADACFWELFRTARGTAFAGVPYTFDLLDRVGFDAMDLPHLRYVTQAGGRLAPGTVTRYAELGERRGWDLFVMYGQTEATARMAYLPPGLAAAHPASIGVPVPGGAFRLDPVEDGPGPDAGEFVYTGPNVMLGYARTPADLARGRDIRELRTGDLARRTPEGLYEIVGRRSHFVKILGLRIDPQRIETALARQGVTALCTGDDTSLLIAAADAPDADADRIRGLAIRECHLPPRAVHVRLLAELPRLPSGKPDYEAIRALPRESDDPRPLPADLRLLYARILGRTDVTPDSSFVSLGGDSLSYVEMSLQLEKRLGSLPPDWHTRPIRDLAPPGELPAPQFPSGARTRRRTLETSVALRALAIFFIVGSHIHVFGVKGGAHLLLAVAGYNFARFHLTDAPGGNASGAPGPASPGSRCRAWCGSRACCCSRTALAGGERPMNIPALTPAAAVDPPPYLQPPADVRTLLPRARSRRPVPAPLWRPAGAPALAGQRAAMNQAALRHTSGPLPVVLYAFTRAGADAHDDLAAAQGQATRQSFTVTDRIVDILDGHGDRDDPTLRRGYARALHLLADPASPVRGVVAVSRASVSPIDRIYEAQLRWIAGQSGGLWLVRGETEI
ncbi:non-ribosomal peptide synthetase [Streptomyces sp. NPDC090029]|uniref:non-ribosomal peptide synthetase n=1 Tax=Streptomyces sp. NPDC090029 TaxID=3365924 RepID=UPI00381579A8